MNLPPQSGAQDRPDAPANGPTLPKLSDTDALLLAWQALDELKLLEAAQATASVQRGVRLTT